MRPLLVKLHRWFGLAAAAFLFISGLTGALIAWDHELDALINPNWYEARTPGLPMDALSLAEKIEAADARLQVTWLPLAVEPGHTVIAGVRPRMDNTTGKPHELDFDQVALDSVSGAVQGSRMWGVVSLAPENLMPFIYKLHYAMHLPEVGGVEVGIWLMGLIAMAWVIDCGIALWISFPKIGQWRRSFRFRWRDGGHKLVFDLHRSGGVWLWLLLLTVAVTSVAMNLREPVMRPIVNAFSPVSPSPLERHSAASTLAGAARAAPSSDWAISRREAVEVARREAVRQGWDTPVGGVFKVVPQGAWGVGLFHPGAEHGDGGLGNTWLYIDAHTGRVIGHEVPGTGTAGDLFLQAMFPLHSGRIMGVPGRMLVSALGVAVAALSLTGVLLWARKRKARLSVRRKAASAPEALLGHTDCR